MRVNRLPADTVARLRQVTPQVLAERLGVLAQWHLEGGSYVPVAIGQEPVGKPWRAPHAATTCRWA